jgi:hypothetical protein
MPHKVAGTSSRGVLLLPIENWSRNQRRHKINLQENRALLGAQRETPNGDEIRIIRRLSILVGIISELFCFFADDNTQIHSMR